MKSVASFCQTVRSSSHSNRPIPDDRLGAGHSFPHALQVIHSQNASGGGTGCSTVGSLSRFDRVNSVEPQCGQTGHPVTLPGDSGGDFLDVWKCHLREQAHYSNLSARSRRSVMEANQEAPGEKSR